MGQEYFINSQGLQDKVSSLLPSQGGAGAGFDLSASTQIIPIIDLTESADGSNFRQDLQKAFSHDSITAFSVDNTTTTIINNTGYYRVFGNVSGISATSTNKIVSFNLTDGTTTKAVQTFILYASSSPDNQIIDFDFIVFIPAGDSMTITSTATSATAVGCSRQIATIDGELVNPN